MRRFYEKLIDNTNHHNNGHFGNGHIARNDKVTLRTDEYKEIEDIERNTIRWQKFQAKN